MRSSKPLAVSDAATDELAKAAFEQLFKSTATDIYLDRRAANDGLARPADIGISDDVFRKLAIKTTARKLVPQVILEVLEAYYGIDATRASLTSEAVEPFALVDGDTLLVEVDSGSAITVSFGSDDFTVIGQATATEAAAVITRRFQQLQMSAFAIPYTDPSTGNVSIRLYSGALGLAGNLRVVGGRSQNVFKFPASIFSSGSDGPQIGTQWQVDVGTGSPIAAGRVRLTWTGGADPDLINVFAGDYVNLYGSPVPSDFRGAYKIVGATTTYVEFEKIIAPASSSFTQVAADDVRFFRPTRRTVQSSGRMATIVQGRDGLEVLMPATTEAVSREIGSGAYVHAGAATNITSASRDAAGLVTVTTASAHQLSTGQWAYVDGMVPAVGAYTETWPVSVNGSSLTGLTFGLLVPLSSGKVLACGGGGGGGSNSAFLWDPNTNTWTALNGMNQSRAGHVGVELKNGKVLVVGGEDGAAMAELFDPATLTWTITGDPSVAAYNATLTLLNDGRALFVGGDSSPHSEAYDPVTGHWTTTALPSSDFMYHGAVKLDDGRVIVFGGVDSLSNSLGLTETYNPLNNTWTAAGTMLTNRFAFAYGLVKTARGLEILAAGGLATFDPGDGLASAELFQPWTGTWHSAASISVARAHPGFTKLSDTQFLMAGGLNTSSAVSSVAEIYDTVNDAWRTTTTVPGSRANYGDRLAYLSPGHAMLLGYDGAYHFDETTDVKAVGGFSGLFKLTSATPGSTTFQFSTPDFAAATTMTGGTVTSFRTSTNTVPGPFIFDEDTGTSVTGTATTLTTGVSKGLAYNTITVADASAFPDAEGYLALGFGTEEAVYPVHYLGRPSSTQLLLDPSFIFPKAVSAAASVTLLAQRALWTPDNIEEVGTFYVTAASAGRVAAAKNIGDVTGAGLSVTKTVIYPSDVGLGNEGLPVSGTDKLSDKVTVWGGDDTDSEIEALRDE
jgi:hypothetical protein